MIYHSTHSDDYLWYLILRGKQKNEKKNWSEQKILLSVYERANEAKL